MKAIELAVAAVNVPLFVLNTHIDLVDMMRRLGLSSHKGGRNPNVNQSTVRPMGDRVDRTHV